MRLAPRADAATESAPTSTGPPASTAACRVGQPSGSTPMTTAGWPIAASPPLTPASRPPPPTGTATTSHPGRSAAISPGLHHLGAGRGDPGRLDVGHGGRDVDGRRDAQPAGGGGDAEPVVAAGR